MSKVVIARSHLWAVAADEKVGAAQGMAALGAEGELSPGALGQRPEGARGYLLPFPRERKRGLGLGQTGSRLLELASGGRELPFPLACPLLLARVKAPQSRIQGSRGHRVALCL